MRTTFTLLLIAFTTAAWAQYPKVSIDSVQYVSDQNLSAGDGTAAMFGDTVVIEGTVTFDACTYALSSSGSRVGSFVQTDPGKKWGGIHVLADPGAIGYSGSAQDLSNATNFLDNLGNGAIGNRVRLFGVVSSFGGNTQLLILPDSTVTYLGFTGEPAPDTVTIDMFSQLSGGEQEQQMLTGEPYEGVFVVVQGIRITDVSTGSNGRFFWSVMDAAGNKLQVRDMSGHLRNGTNDDWCTGVQDSSYTPDLFDITPKDGAFIEYLKGIIVEYNGQYYIAPRDTSDIGPVTAAPPIVRNINRGPVVPASSDNVTISATIEDYDGTVAGAVLYFSYGYGNTAFSSVTMNNTSGDTWAGTIPAAGADSTWVNFWIKATDNDGLVTNYPDTLAKGSFYLVLDEGINSIKDIQYTPLSGGSSPWTGDTITSMNVKAVVTSSNKSWSLGSWATIQDDTAPWSGIFVEPATGQEWYRGDSVLITSAVVWEYYGLTILEDITYQILSRNNPLPAPITNLNPDSINQKVFAQSEPYEGMLLTFFNAAVADTNPDAPGNFGEFMINTNTSASQGLRVDDISGEISITFNVDSLTPGQVLDSIRGVLYYSFGNFKLLPRNRDDIAGFNTVYPREIVTFRFAGLNPVVNGTVNQQAGTILLTVPDTADITSLVPSIEISGIGVNPPSGQANDFSSPQTYTVTAPVDSATKSYTVTVDTFHVGVADAEFVSSLQAYPNPAVNKLTIQIETTEADKIQFVMYNLLGEKLQEQGLRFQSGLNRIEVSLKDIPAGIYFYEIKGEKVQAAGKVTVVK